MNEEKRFWEKVKKTKTCWVWKGSKAGGRSEKGRYGYFRFFNKNGYAHRFSYQFFNGHIPKHFQIDHLCKNNLCVNPEHLEAVAQNENNKRSNSLSGINSRKTECLRGHKFTPQNTYWHGPHQSKRGCIHCRDLRNNCLRARLRKIRSLKIDSY